MTWNAYSTAALYLEFNQGCDFCRGCGTGDCFLLNRAFGEMTEEREIQRVSQKKSSFPFLSFIPSQIVNKLPGFNPIRNFHFNGCFGSASDGQKNSYFLPPQECRQSRHCWRYSVTLTFCDVTPINQLKYHNLDNYRRSKKRVPLNYVTAKLHSKAFSTPKHF